ncbi:MAG: hypothetical protein IH582_16895 [Afipia sp.]|nr:hypothetical protein [Afipia sp.]
MDALRPRREEGVVVARDQRVTRNPVAFEPASDLGFTQVSVGGTCGEICGLE